MKDRIILTDCDGCLVWWENAFEKFMSEKGINKLPNTDHEYSMYKKYSITVEDSFKYVKEFNESSRIETISPFRDSVEYIGKLSNLGFNFIVVTSISDHPDAKVYRRKNLTDLFGDVFLDIHCLKMGESKATILQQWSGTEYFWIEDHMRQAEAGYEAGLKTVLINHPYNMHYSTDLFPRVSNTTPWEEIYSMVVDHYRI